MEIEIGGAVVRVNADIPGSRPSPSAARGARGMIPQGARVLLRAAAVDFRKGPEGLVSLVRDAGAIHSTVLCMFSGRNEPTG